jgi:hypothetical protein
LLSAVFPVCLFSFSFKSSKEKRDVKIPRTKCQKVAPIPFRFESNQRRQMTTKSIYLKK